jgi:2'-5' RNA ligase
MPFAVELFLHGDSEQLVRNLWSDLARVANTSFMIEGGYRPHVTLGVFETYSSPRFEQEFRRFAAGLGAIPIRFDYLGLFLQPRRVVYLGPVVTDQLLLVHRQFNERFGRLVCGSDPLCPPGRWVPHCTLAFDIPAEAVPEAMRICSGVALRFVTEVQQIGLVEYPKRREVVICQLEGSLSRTVRST